MLRNSGAADAGPAIGPDDTPVGTPVGTPVPDAASLTSLLGEQRAAIVDHLRRDGESTVCTLATHLGVSEVATRRHLAVLEEQDLVSSRDVADGPGRPARHYRLTDRAMRLFPERSAALADELLQFLADQHGSTGVRQYLQWRLERQCAELEEQVTADDLQERLVQLADALSDAGFDATVDQAGDRFVLRQQHCAIYDVAREHPEMCAWEAATFSRVLGRDVRLSRQQTRTQGADACVCCVSPRASDAPPPQRVLPLVETTVATSPRSA